MNDFTDESELEMARKRRKKTARSTLANHLEFLISKSMADDSILESQIARKMGTSQKTLNNIRRCDQEGRPNPGLDNIEAAAHYFNMPVWQLLIPNTPEELVGDDDIEELITLFTKASPEKRESILKIARATAR